MKKITSLLLALVMALALAVPAFAEDTWPTETDKKKDVTASYAEPEDKDAGKVYYLTITWDEIKDTKLTYTGEKTTYTWDGVNMKYDSKVTNQTEVGWKGSTGYTVTVTNQSNAKVSASTSASANFGLVATATGDTTKTELASAARDKSGNEITYKQVGVVGNKDTLTVAYTYADTNKEATAPIGVADGETSVIVGNITVTVNK